MECPVCQSESPEGKKFCAECGAELPRPQTPPEMQPVVAVSTAPKRTWCSTHLKGLFALAIAIVVMLASVGLIYTQPWSKIKVLIAHDEHTSIGVNVYIDGVLKASVEVSPGGWKIIGAWAVTSGTHSVTVDGGDWYYVSNWLFASYWAYEEPDGTPDFIYTYEVGPLYTKNAYAQL